MRSTSQPFRYLQALLFLAVTLFATHLRADIVWTPQAGWQVEGGALAPYFSSTEGRNALELMNKARADEEAGHESSAIKGYLQVTKSYGTSIYAPEALFRLGGLYNKERKFTKAFDAYQEIVSKHPNYAKFNETIGAQYRIATGLVDGARGRILGVFPGFKNRGKGVEQLEKILVSAPYSEYAPLALMSIARGHSLMGDPDGAIDALDRMINNYPQNFLAPDAYIKLAQAHADLVAGPNYDQASSRQALTYFEDFLILFPNDPNATAATKGEGDMRTMLAQSRINIGDFYYYKRSNYPAARVFYNEAITLYPNSPVAEKAQKLLADLSADEARHNTPKADVPDRAAPAAKKRFWLF
ncbi:outer membrane protein assembly factor BamD [Opitutaceae bacterium TAV4]|nr:outer membrane protein assembly factor BamD [Opitutaceae bacterium TAV4]RRJ98702.1 outer membrane protein assembly factor BamD [Opitutaceae bacterium TAV3]